MSKYASYYAPINQALQNFNAQINENARRKMAAEHNLAQTQLAVSKFMYDQTDPQRVLAQQKAADQLKPTQINVSRNMPSEGSDKTTLEHWNKFKSYVGPIVGDVDAQINSDGNLVGADGYPIVKPKWEAQKIQSRIDASQMLAYDEDAQMQSSLRALANDIEKEQSQYNKTKNPQLQMKIRGMQEQLSKQTATYENPQRQLMSVQRKMRQIEDYLTKAYTSDNPDSGWIDTLKWQGALAEKKYNSLLKALGRDGKAEGIQLKRYINPHSGEVIEYPVSKYDGASYSITNPVTGGKKHMGIFLLDNANDRPGTPIEQYNMVNSYIEDYNKTGAQIGALKNAIVKDASADAIISSMKITDPDMIAMITQATIDKKYAKEQIGSLESYRKQQKENMFELIRDPLAKNRLKKFFNEQVDDPFDLTGTSVGDRYKDTDIPPELITP